MKNMKKKVFVVALAVCLLAIISISSLAWFTATDNVENDFMIGDSDGTGLPNFTVSVWENENDGDDMVDADGDGDPKLTGKGNVYNLIAPGDVIAKNPTVENTGDYDQWIRVLVTFNNFNIIEKACQRVGIGSDLREWVNIDTESANANWTASNDETVVDRNNGTVTYVYYYNNKLAKDETVTLFDTLTIPSEFEQQDMAYEDGGFKLTVKAEAIQAANTGANAMIAFANCWKK